MRPRHALSLRLRAARFIDMLRQDVSYAVRGLSRSPGPTTAIILTLGLGIGANAAIFSALDRVYFQAPPGVVDPGAIRRLYAHRVGNQSAAGSVGQVTPFLATRDLLDLEEATRGKARVAGYTHDPGTRLEPGHQQVRTTFVSSGYFDFVGVRPALGRFFAPDEDEVPGPPLPVVVISDAFWRQHYAAAPDVIGRTLRIDQTTYTIVGVAPPEFEGLELEVTDLWAPLANVQGGDITWLRVVARVDRGTDPGALDQLLTRQYRATHAGDPAVGDRSTIITAPILAARGPALAGVSVHRIPGMSERSLGLLVRLAGVGLVVALIAIANVASLLLMRAIRRQREIAVRLALGISRARLVSQLVTESVLLGAVAGAAALAAASWTGNALRLQLAGFRWPASVIDHRVVLFAMGIALVGGVLAGLAPAVFALRTDVGTAIKSSSAGTRAGVAIRSGLLVTQSALCMALLASAGVFLQSLRRAGDVDRGFDPDRTIVVSLPAYYPSSEQDVALAAERLRSVPGVASVGRSRTWLADIGMVSKVGPSRSDTIGASARGPSIEFVEPEYLRAAGFRVVAGRPLEASDKSVPVAMVNQALASALFAGRDAVGSCIHVREPASPCRTIVGVVGDIRWDVTEPSIYRVYVPLEQAWTIPNPALIPNYLVVRMRATASSADVARLRSLTAPLISGGSELGVRRISDMLEPELRPWRLAATLFLILGLLGLAAAATGIYGLVAFDVTQRSRELGVRIALGATSASIVRLVLGSGLRVVLMGAAAGAAAALVAGRVMASLLFATSPYDPAVLIVTTLTLTAAATVASLVPAWRAIRVDPARVLSSE